MGNTELAKGIYWVGAVDWDIRDFHGYSTYKGSTYNAFLVIDEKITLFDTVKRSHMGDLLRNIRQYIEPEKIDYLVINHVEMDHTGSLPELMKIIKPEKVFCSPMGHKALLDHFHMKDWPYEVVKSGAEVSLGERTVQFIETRMLHWPDSMFSFLKEDGILFSSDAFGQHYATTERFDHEVPYSVLMEESAKYYANILNLFSPLIKKLLGSLEEMNLDIKMIAPDHGVIWTDHISDILTSYQKWANQESREKALVIYSSMWHSTERMAHAIGAGLTDAGVSAEMINLKVHHRSDIITKMLESKAVILGSSTLNNGMLPEMAEFLCYMKGLKPGNKLGAAFGSFGWSGEAVGLLNAALTEMKIDIVEDGMKIRYVPTEDQLNECTEMGRRIGQKIKESCAG